MSDATTPIDAVAAQSKAYYEATREFMTDYQRLELAATSPPNPVVPWDELTEAHQVLYAHMVGQISTALVEAALALAATSEKDALALKTIRRIGL